MLPSPGQTVLARRAGPTKIVSSWGLTGNLKTARFRHTATLLANGKVLVVGGADSNFNPIKMAEVYDPATKTWGSAGDLNSARIGHTATLLANGKVLVAGGIGLNSAEIYDPANNTWTVAGNLNAIRDSHTATLLANSKVVVAGGNGPAGDPVESAELFDPAGGGGQGSWIATGQLNTPRRSHTATRLGNGRVLLVGGGGPGESVLKSVEIYDPAGGVWSATAELKTGRLFHTATLLASGKVLVAGGFDGSDALQSSEIYDAATGTWNDTGNLNAARYSHTATLLANNQVIVVGGINHNGEALATTELFDPAGGGGQGSFAASSNLNIARVEHTATLIAGGQVLAASGVGGTNVLDSAELLSLDTICPTITLGPATIPAGTVGAVYTATTFTQSGGAGAITFNLSGALPPGMAFSGGALSGTPTQPGNYPITVTATDAEGCTGRRDYVLVINCQSVTISPSTIPTGALGFAYNLSFTQTGGIGEVVFSLNGQLPAGLQFSPSGLLSGTPTQVGNFPVTITAVDLNNCIGSRQYTLIINQDPGTPFPSSSAGSSQKPGSLLFYNLYTSTSIRSNAQNTRISVTNTNISQSVAIRLFFIDGSNCSMADSLICLSPNQTANFLASDLDPDVTGYLVAAAIDERTGCPIAFNFLIGDEYVKMTSGHAANLGAEAFTAVEGASPVCSPESTTAILRFDGIQYNPAPSMLLLNNVFDRPGGNDTLLVINRVGGNLATSAGLIGALTGELYDDLENGYSFTVTAGACQFRSSLSVNFPRTTPRFDQVIPAGRSGWMKLSAENETAVIGAAINFNPNKTTNSSAYSQGHNLHHFRFTTAASLTIPLSPPAC